MNIIKYKSGYKYQLNSTYSLHLGASFDGAICEDVDFITIWPDTELTIDRGYAWDGPSGPTFDTKSAMRASLVHDALYQLIREGHLSEKYYEQADRLLRSIAVEDGMWRWRAWLWYHAVRKFGKKHNSKPRPVLEAP